VDVHFEQPKARTTTFYTQDGAIAGYLLTGAATITVSNADVADGPNLTFNISGPGKFDPEGNLIGSGPWLLGLPEDVTTEPFLIILIGHFVLSSTGDRVSSGRVVDLCTALA